MLNELLTRPGRSRTSQPRNRARGRIGRILVVLALALAGLIASPAAAHADHDPTVAPDQWHCAWANNADDICIHMNQFLGWWTGFKVQYYYYGGSAYPVTVSLSYRITRWSSSTGRYETVRTGSWPESQFFYGNNGTFGRDTGADLPYGTCVTGIASVTTHYPGGQSRNFEVRVCR